MPECRLMRLRSPNGAGFVVNMEIVTRDRTPIVCGKQLLRHLATAHPPRHHHICNQKVNIPIMFSCSLQRSRGVFGFEQNYINRFSKCNTNQFAAISSSSAIRIVIVLSRSLTFLRLTNRSAPAYLKTCSDIMCDDKVPTSVCKELSKSAD